jgi:hypothetical protein
MRGAGELGLSLIEVAIIMTATFTIMGVLVPSITATVRRAEETSATTAATNIKNQAIQALTDMNYNNYTIDGAKNGTQVVLLVGDGDIAAQNGAVTGTDLWARVTDLSTIDFLEYHIVSNGPGGDPLNAYAPGGANQWRGAYLTGPVDPDPWGNRYAINAEYFGNGGAKANDVVVLSAGPDEELDTNWAANPLTVGDDDIMVLVEP